MNIRFRHVALHVSDLATSVAFYCDHLGFCKGLAFVDAAGNETGAYLYLNTGVFLELFPKGPAPLPTIRRTSCCVRARRVDCG